MSINIVHPPSRQEQPQLPVDNVTVSPPAEREFTGRKKGVAIALRIGIPVLMAAAILTMILSGGRRFGMMGMMMVVMMISMVIGNLFNQGGDDDADTEKNRQFKRRELNQLRPEVHAMGRGQHSIAIKNFPHPRAMPSLMEHRDTYFWGSRPGKNSAIEGTNLHVAPFFNAAIGTGDAALYKPATVDGDTQPHEDSVDPVTLQANRMFLANQNIVISPIGIDLADYAFGLRASNTPEGHDMRTKLTRRVVTSLAYLHSPNNVHIGIITDNPDEWDWLKWLPHTENTYADESPNGSFPRLFWPGDMPNAMRDIAELSEAAANEETLFFIIVDTPDEELVVPHSLETHPRVMRESGRTVIENVTFFATRALSDRKITRPESRIRIEDDATISMLDRTGLARIDDVTRTDALLAATAMAAYRPVAFGDHSTDNGDDELGVGNAPMTLLEAIGVENVKNIDVRGKWAATDKTSTLNFSAGFKVDAKGNRIGNEVAIDIQDYSKNKQATGPHGLFQGKTGTGKSYFLKAILLMLCLRYSPKRFVFLAADFKGASTFRDLQYLPHCLATLSNIGSVDMVARTRDVIMGESHRRQQLFDEYEVSDIDEWRAKQRRHPELNMPDMPNFLIVFDEFEEFIVNHREYKNIFASIGRVGRSLGIHMLLTSQEITTDMLGGAEKNVQYGISLYTDVAQASRTVIKTDKALQLPPARVALMKDVNNELTYVQSVLHHAKYDPPEGVVRTAAPEVGDDDNPIAEVARFDLATQNSGRVIDHDDTENVPDISPSRGRHAADDDDDQDFYDEFHAVLDRIAEEADGYTDVYQMWTRAMNEPVSFGDVRPAEFAAPQAGSGPTPRVLIGRTDLPFEHRQVPMEMDFSDGQSWLVKGHAKSGRTTLFETLIVSAGKRYLGNYLSFMVYDRAGTDLSTVKDMPNVSYYAAAADDEGWLRIRGEIDALYKKRNALFSERMIRSVDDYIRAKANGTIAVNDAYGHVVVIVDGLDTILDGDTDGSMKRYLQKLAADYGRVGIHLVGTDSGAVNRMNSVAGYFTSSVYLKMDSQAITGVPRDAREFMKEQVPDGDPGRAMDLSIPDDLGNIVARPARVLLPQVAETRPERIVGGVARFDTRIDHVVELEQFGAQIRDELSRAIAAHNPDMSEGEITRAVDASCAPKLQKVGTNVPFRTVWEAHTASIDPLTRPRHQRPIPIGVDVATAYVASLPVGQQSHLIVTGDRRTGLTTSLQAHMTAVSNSYRPEEAGIIVLDKARGLWGDFKKLVERGFAKEGNYVRTDEQVDKVCGSLCALAKKNSPGDQDLDNLDARDYVKSKELFVYVEQFDRFTGGNQMNALDQLIQTIKNANADVGIHIITSVSATQITEKEMRWPSMKALRNDIEAPMLMLSSTVRGNILGQRFKERPAGRGLLVEGGTNTRVVQVPKMG